MLNFAQFFSVKYFARSFTVKPVNNYYNSCKKSPCSSLAPTAIIQLLVLLFLLIVYELTELCFPESPDMIELKKLRKKQAKLEKKKEKEKTKEKADTPSRTNSDAK